MNRHHFLIFILKKRIMPAILILTACLLSAEQIDEYAAGKYVCYSVWYNQHFKDAAEEFHVFIPGPDNIITLSRCKNIGLVRTIWKFDPGKKVFISSHSKNIKPVSFEVWTEYDVEYDYHNGYIKKKWTFSGGKTGRTVTVLENLEYSPFVYAEDAGLYFILISHFIRQENFPESILYDAGGQLIYMKPGKDQPAVFDGNSCRRMDIGREGLWSLLVGQKGEIYVSADNGSKYLQSYRMKIGLSWEMPFVQMDLYDRKDISAEEWENIVRGVIDEEIP